ncbi:MAG TPA: glycosyltransferase family 2 protein [Alphaproteobacteria bacterium]|nr:glycosyltransferase family 2 protein [Alphaproteobacteria bacterium]
MSSPRIAVVVPCYNEEAAIAKVVADFRAALPEATIYVYDNNSTDDTIAVAREAGAVVGSEPRRGKGAVVRRMFADVEADIYVLVDGDDTYEAAASRAMVDRLIAEKLDMINGRRVTNIQAAYRPGHRFGNRMLTGIVQYIFGDPIQDLLSGYRVFSRRFVKSFPTIAEGFGIETEMTVHALQLHMPIAEMPCGYKDRPAGSTSKLRTYRDGILILNTILALVRQERPMTFFGIIAGLLAVLAVVLAYPVVVTFAQTGLVPRFPTAILATGIMLAAFLSLTSGVILDSVTRGRWEVKRLQYLSLRSPFRDIGN